MEKEASIGKLYNYGALKVEKTKHLAYEDKQGPHGIHIEAPSALFGIEVEVENMYSHVPIEYYWTVKEDGSLRNSGLEFTSIPLRGYQIPYAIRYLTAALYRNNKPEFSNRCSVHVHLNVRDMTWNEIKTFVLLYSIFERHFFNIAGTKREESIFCVPLYKTDQLKNLDNFEEHAQEWYKYSAINCGTILGNGVVPKFGTIEFRHLYGTVSEPIIMDWINNIMCLRNATQLFSYEELKEKLKEMNTTSEYVQLYTKIFKQYANLRMMQKKDFEYCVTQSKLALWGDTIFFQYAADSAFYKYAHGEVKQKEELVKNFFDDQMNAPLNVTIKKPPPIYTPEQVAIIKQAMPHFNTGGA